MYSTVLPGALELRTYQYTMEELSQDSSQKYSPV